MTELEDQQDRDHAALEVQAALEDQADEANGGSDRGRRGLQGPRGRAGSDSDSIEVLTEVLAKLAQELVGLRKDVQTERKGRRLSLLVLFVALSITAVVVGVGYSNYRALNTQQATAIRANRYDQQTGDHQACERGNENRDSRRNLFLNLYDLLETTEPATPRTPAEQDVLDGFLAKARLDVVTQTMLVDCDAVTPAPEGERPS